MPLFITVHSIYKKLHKNFNQDLKKKNRTSRVIVLSVQKLLFCNKLKHLNLNILYILKKLRVRMNFDD